MPSKSLTECSVSLRTPLHIYRDCEVVPEPAKADPTGNRSSDGEEVPRGGSTTRD
jgi:hypothetical protein